MVDAKKMLDDLLGTNVPGTETTVGENLDKAKAFAKENPVATGVLAAVLLGTRPGRRVAGTALRLGGLAAIAGLAYKAWQSHKEGAAPGTTTAGGDDILPAPAGHQFDPSTAPQGEAEFALVLVRAMVAAANADGHIDDDERKHIAEKLSEAGAGADVQSFIAGELEAPARIEALATAAVTEAQKVELYTAARLAASEKTQAEHDYLERLAQMLGLDRALVDHIETTVADVAVPPAA